MYLFLQLYTLPVKFKLKYYLAFRWCAKYAIEHDIYGVLRVYFTMNLFFLIRVFLAAKIVTDDNLVLSIY